jgi:hypothetical protein
MSTPRRIAVATIAALAGALPAQAHAAGFESAQLIKRAPVRAAAAPNPYTFVGTTAQFPCQMYDDIFCGTVNVFMSKDMKRVKRLLVGFEAQCQAPDKFFGTNLMLQGLPAKKGRSSSSFAASGPLQADLPGDLTARADVAVKGKAKLGSTGSGSFKITVGIFDSAGHQIDSCATGRQPFTLKALKRR